MMAVWVVPRDARPRGPSLEACGLPRPAPATRAWPPASATMYAATHWAGRSLSLVVHVVAAAVAASCTTEPCPL